MNYKLICGDSLEKLKLLPDNSIDSCITDPPAGISFMGKEWDDDKGSMLLWQQWLSSIFVEVNRVLKPGGHCLVWSIPRTSHHTGMALENAGFEVRDIISHVFGCLSMDTEILTKDGWSYYTDDILEKEVLSFDISTKTFTFVKPNKKYLYDNKYPAYRIQSDFTDQIVSRDHRVIIEREGEYLFCRAQELQSEENIPILESSSYQSQSTGQQNRKSNVIQEQPTTQTIRSTRAAITEIEYNDNVWCVEVPSGAFVARRNGKIFITGNSGFPKSHNIGKGVDKKMGNEREVVGKRIQRVDGTTRNQKTNGGFMKENIITEPYDGYVNVEKGGSIYEGYGTGLKPAVELWWLVRKPISEKTIVDNVLRWNTGGINVDGCRIGFEDTQNPATNPLYRYNNDYKQVTDNGQKEGVNVKFTNSLNPPNNLGRFPSNFLHNGSEEVMEEFAKAGISKTNHKGTRKDKGENGGGTLGYSRGTETPRTDEGTPARFFYCSKPSTRERNMGCDELEEQIQNDTSSNIRTYNDRCKNCGKKFIGSPETICSCDNPETDKSIYKNKNNHPCIKSVRLMAYLITLITPPQETSIVLDPFLGSGSTGIAALLLNKKFIGIEKEEEYIKIAETRIKNFEKYRQFLK